MGIVLEKVEGKAAQGCAVIVSQRACSGRRKGRAEPKFEETEK